MTRRSFVLPAISLTGCGSAPQSQRWEFRIAVGGRAALDFIPVYLASALGFFRSEGIRVTLQDLASTPKALQALLGGSTFERHPRLLWNKKSTQTCRNESRSASACS